MHASNVWRVSFAVALVTGLVALLADCSGDDGAGGGAVLPADPDAAADAAAGDAKTSDGGISSDATPDAPRGPRCNPNRPFGTPTMVLENSFYYDQSARLSSDELTVYFAGSGSNAQGPIDLWIATRASTSVPFKSPTKLTELSTSEMQLYPTVTADGLTLYYEGYPDGGRAIFRAMRPQVTAPWGKPTMLTGLDLFMPYVSPDGTRLYGSKELPGGPPYNADIYYVDLPYAGGPSIPVPGTVIPDLQYWPVVSADGLALYYSYPLLGPYRWELGKATRATTSDPFGIAVKVAELDTDAGGDESATWISPDGCAIYFRRLAADLPGNASGLMQAMRGL